MQGKGQVVYWNEKGYGFVRPQGSHESIFVHASGINADGPNRYLLKGDIVTYDVVQTDRGTNAVNVSVIFESE